MEHYYSPKSPVTPERRPHNVFTAFKTVADRRVARCKVASNSMETLWKRCKDAVQLHLKRWRLFSNMLKKQRCGVF